MTREDPSRATPIPTWWFQDDVFNHSRITTLVVCALTSNLHRANEGTILLRLFKRPTSDQAADLLEGPKVGGVAARPARPDPTGRKVAHRDRERARELRRSSASGQSGEPGTSSPKLPGDPLGLLQARGRLRDRGLDLIDR